MSNESKADKAADHLSNAMRQVAHTVGENADALNEAIVALGELRQDHSETIESLREVLDALKGWKQAGQDWFDAYCEEQRAAQRRMVAERAAAVTAVDLGGGA